MEGRNAAKCRLCGNEQLAFKAGLCGRCFGGGGNSSLSQADNAKDATCPMNTSRRESTLTAVRGGPTASRSPVSTSGGGASSSASSGRGTTINAPNTSGGGGSASTGASSTTASRSSSTTATATRRSSSTTTAATRRSSSTISTAYNAANTGGGGGSSSTISTAGDTGSGSGGSSATRSATSNGSNRASRGRSRSRSRTSAAGAPSRETAQSRSASRGGSTDLPVGRGPPICKMRGCRARAVASAATDGQPMKCDKHSLFTPTGRRKGASSKPLTRKEKLARSEAHVGRRCASIDEDGTGRIGEVVGVDLGVAVDNMWTPTYTIQFDDGSLEECRGDNVMLSWSTIYGCIERAFARRGPLTKAFIGRSSDDAEVHPATYVKLLVTIPFSKKMSSGQGVVHTSKRMVEITVFGKCGADNASGDDAGSGGGAQST